MKGADFEEESALSVLNLFSELEDLDSIAPNWVSDLEFSFRNTKSTELKRRSLELAEKKKEKRFVYSVISALTDPDFETRQSAFRCVQVFRDDRAMPNVLDLANSTNPVFREYFLEAAIWIKDERVQNLISKFASDDSPGI
ncbi:HEAT repeat domain-containing protein [Leptospira perolatii]|uniref:HEAT repeat domain-containing protein n=1 Tax=Leptospira perolatii TaxID=2023191 RepID=UPI001FAEF816|nr:HEAT repeat domain-containing protein [Leptospira perolatii]